MKRRWIIVALILLTVPACNLPARGSLTPPASSPPNLASPAATTPTRIPIETLLARPTSTFVPTATPRLALVSPLSHPVNCRFGPSTAYAVVGGLELGRQAEVVGKTIDVTWWYVKNPSNPSTYCWLAAELVQTVGRVEALPVVEPEPARVTDIELRADPPSLNVACTAFPQYIIVNADLTTNGPATVTWRWETSEGETIGANPRLFLENGTQSDFVYYTVKSAKDYWIQVHILTPNETTSRLVFKATCTP